VGQNGVTMTIGEAAIVLVLAWLALTLLFQFRPFSRRLQLLDLLGLLPRWLFFTQGVGTYTLAVEVRIRDASGRIGAWEPAPLWPEWQWWHAVFLPDHALSGALWLAADRLARRAQRGDSGASLAATHAFATLQSHLQRQLPLQDLQFAVLRNERATDDLERVFVSEFARV
jgi:hypothetical protein